MKPAKQPLRFPEEFRETFTTHHLDPAMMLQLSMDMGCFYLEVQGMGENAQLQLTDRMIVGLMRYQTSSKQWVDRDLAKINAKYLAKLLEQCTITGLTERQHLQKALKMITAWEKEAGPLMDYPRQITLENGHVLEVSFDFFMISVLLKRSIQSFLLFYMERFSLSNYTAYLYSRSKQEREKLEYLVRDLSLVEGVFLEKTPAQQELYTTYRGNYERLTERMKAEKSAQKRFPIIRAYMKEWYQEVLRLNV